jgi:FKBP-type peptidyl-prolyl cis-trans isomerase FklB
MKRIFLLALTGGVILFIQPVFSQTTSMDSVSYSLGLILAKNMKSQGVSEIDVKSMSQAISDVFEGKELAIQPAEAQAKVQSYFQTLEAKKAEAATREAQDFLAQNKQREEVKETESGLQYEVLEAGNSGEKPTTASKVTVHYEGRLMDGKIFDSSYERGKPATFGLTQVISGWTEGLQLMDVGSKFRFYIPYDLAYGAQGRPPQIPPYSMLIFDVELVAIQ